MDPFLAMRDAAELHPQYVLMKNMLVQKPGYQNKERQSENMEPVVEPKKTGKAASQ